ncbi:aldose 1-epimerase family protein [Okibacterium fritillariae]|uniref:aldose 1-epimerase family protein n=1 Tax=Okibacterium fritillariae TaxID=123320 RepID=UPI0040553B87
MTHSRAVTGDQYVLTRQASAGTVSAVITQVGAGIRRLSVNGIDIVPPYDEGVQRPYGSGIVLVPWPNRIRDGKYDLEGEEMQLDLTEPDKQNAIHGLLRFTAYDVAEQTDDSVTLSATVYPQHGYPFLLDTSVRYRLVDAGLEVTHTIENVGTGTAPTGIGTHPYVTIGDVDPDDLTVTLNCETRFTVDERLLPTGEVPVEGTEYDLRGGRRLGGLVLDDGFGQAIFENGVTEHTVAADDGRVVTVWGDENFPYWQVFTTKKYPGQSTAVAIEPMTAPTDAFNSGRDVRYLAPGETFQATWGVRADGFAAV